MAEPGYQEPTDEVAEQGESSPAAEPRSEDEQPLTAAQMRAELMSLQEGFQDKLDNLYRGVQSQVTPARQAVGEVAALKAQMLANFDALYKAVLPEEQYLANRQAIQTQAEQQAKDAQLEAFRAREKAALDMQRQRQQEATTVEQEWTQTYKPVLQRLARKQGVEWRDVEGEIRKLEGAATDDDPTGWLGILDKAEAHINTVADAAHRSDKRLAGKTPPKVPAGARPGPAAGDNPLHDWYQQNPATRAYLATP